MEINIALRSDQWAEISIDMLDEIVKCIDSYGDFVRFCVVCKSWNSQLSKIPKYLKTPLLLLPFDDENNITRLTYHDGEKKVIHRLELSETKKTLTVGSSYGWLITLGFFGRLQMLEPFTRGCIDLPSIFTFPEIIDYSSEYIRFHMLNWCIKKIILSSPPNDNDQDFMAVAIYQKRLGCCRLGYCMRDDKRWKDFTIPEPEKWYEDVIFHEGKIYAVTVKGEIYEYDIKTKVGRMSEIKPLRKVFSTSFRYLVGTNDGLLSIERRYVVTMSSPKRFYRTHEFRVFKQSKSNWTEMKNLGDYMVVVGHNSSICYVVPSGKESCIYYSDDLHRYYNHWDNERDGGHDNGVFYLQDRTIRSFDYLFPGQDEVFPTPIWLL